MLHTTHAHAKLHTPAAWAKLTTQVKLNTRSAKGMPLKQSSQNPSALEKTETKTMNR